MRETIETTYADLRPDDLVIDKTGKAWPIAELLPGSLTSNVTFWLCDPVTKIKTHLMSKDRGDKVTVSRIPKQADEAAKLEAEFPEAALPENYNVATFTAETAGTDEAVANVMEYFKEATVEAEVTAEEVDAANASTEEKPVQLPPFESMTILEMRSHLYLLHGLYAHDMKSRDETIAMHTKATAEHADGRLQTPAHIPHTHDGEALK